VVVLISRPELPGTDFLPFAVVAGAMQGFALAALYSGLAVGAMGVVSPTCGLIIRRSKVRVPPDPSKKAPQMWGFHAWLEAVPAKSRQVSTKCEQDQPTSIEASCAVDLYERAVYGAFRDTAPLRWATHRATSTGSTPFNLAADPTTWYFSPSRT
jgi:hypothetical protein